MTSLRRATSVTVAALGFLCASWMDPVHSQSTQVVSGHPRIYLRPTDLPPLRARVTQAPVSAYYNQMRSRMDATSARHSNNEVAAFELESLALLHAVAGGTAYRNKILTTWRFPAYAAGQVSHWDLPYQVMAHSLALDYLWNDLSIAERAQLGHVIVAMMDDLYNYAPYNVAFANQMSDYSNQLYYHLGALAFAGIVLSGEGINDARAQFYLSEASTLLNTHMIPAINQEAGGDADLARRSGFVGNGGWGEDMGHLDMTHPLLGRMVEAWRTGVNENLFPAFNGLARFAQYVLYLRRPNGLLAPKGNATYQLGLSDKNAGTLGCLMSARYNDSLGKHIKDVTFSGTTYGFHQLGAVLWCNASLPAPDFAALPKAIHFQGQGEVVMRSGFGPQDTWVYVRSGPIFNGHQHDDQGNLLIDAYGGELLVENAGSGVNHETVYHNSIRIAGADQIPYGNNAVQRAQPMTGTAHERGRVTGVQIDPRYAYVATDFGTAYADAVVPPPKAGKVTREVVTVYPDVVFVRDRVQGVGNLDILFHVWSGAGTLDTGARTLSVARSTGRAWLKAVHPDTAILQLSAQGATDLLTVRAPGSGSAIDFLHVIYLSPGSATFAPTDLVPISNAAQLGASFRDRHGRFISVVFRRTGVGLSTINLGGSAPNPPANFRIIR